MKIRLARLGRIHSPFYRIVAADARAPRDGKYIELLGSYRPLLEKESKDRIVLKKERIEYWLGCGAKPTNRVQILLERNNLLEKKKRSNPNKGKPKAKALEKTTAKKEAKSPVDEKS